MKQYLLVGPRFNSYGGVMQLDIISSADSIEEAIEITQENYSECAGVYLWIDSDARIALTKEQLGF